MAAAMDIRRNHRATPEVVRGKLKLKVFKIKICFIKLYVVL